MRKLRFFITLLLLMCSFIVYGVTNSASLIQDERTLEKKIMNQIINATSINVVAKMYRDPQVPNFGTLNKWFDDIFDQYVTETIRLRGEINTENLIRKINVVGYKVTVKIQDSNNAPTLIIIKTWIQNELRN